MMPVQTDPTTAPVAGPRFLVIRQLLTRLISPSGEEGHDAGWTRRHRLLRDGRPPLHAERGSRLSFANTLRPKEIRMLRGCSQGGGLSETHPVYHLFGGDAVPFPHNSRGDGY
jgi:hypothetical protein